MTLHIPDHPRLPTQDILRAALVLNGKRGDSSVLSALLSGLYQVNRINVRLHLFSKKDSLGCEVKVIRMLAHRRNVRSSRPQDIGVKYFLIEMHATPSGLYETCNLWVEYKGPYAMLLAADTSKNWLSESDTRFTGRSDPAPFAIPYQAFLHDFKELPEDANGGDGDRLRRDGGGAGGGGRGNGGDGGTGGDGTGDNGQSGGAGLADVLRHNVLFSAPERLFEILDQI